MKKTLFATLLVVTLTACAPAPPTTDIQSTAFAIVQTGVALTQTALPTSTPSPTFTPTATIVVYPSPSPIPTFPPPPILTPDALQVKRWREIEKELARGILPMFPIETVLCEWDILGHSKQEVYVWAICASLAGDDERPAVIRLEDGSFYNVEIPERGVSSDIDRIFPKEIQMKFSFYTGGFYGRLEEMYNHIKYRQVHPEEPPLVILSATPMP